MSAERQAWEIMYKDLREGYAALDSAYERLKDHHKESIAEMEDSITELAVAYNNAQNEIRILKNGGNTK